MALANSPAGEIEFDTQALQARGVDPALSALFRQAPRFMPGISTITLTVNGSGRGKIKARFDASGQLCADQAFQLSAGLISPPGFSTSSACFDLKTAWPQTELQLEPGENRVDVVVPAEALASAIDQAGNWDHGGFAGMANYDGQYMASSGAGSGINFMQLASEVGLNLDNWILRSRQTVARFNGQFAQQHQAAYAQRSFTAQKKVLQAGQVFLANSLFGAGQVLGFQLFPEAALQNNSGGAGVVAGIADSQSVVEVRQSGALIYSTLVPAGPFRLQGFPLLNTRTDLAVTLTSSNGEKREFTVPAATLIANGTLVAPGIMFGAGKLQQSGSSNSPLVATLATGWQLATQTTLNTGLLASSFYRAFALNLNTQLAGGIPLSLQSTLAEDQHHHQRGALISLALSHNLSERVGVSVNVSQQTAGYRELNDALQLELHDPSGNNQQQIGVGISWATKALGSLSLSWGRSRSFDDNKTDYLRGGWSKQFGQVYLGASLERNGGDHTRSAENRAYLTINIPFGGRSVSTYFNSSSNSRRTGIRYSDRSSQDRGWSLASERELGNQNTSHTLSVDQVTSVSQLNGSLNHDSGNLTSWALRAAGGMVAHSGGITLSPYSISDTFGIAKVGDEAGVRLETPGGPAWTNSRGYAVLPALNGYQRAAIQIDTRSLAKNVDISNAVQETTSARGSVSYVNFDLVRTRRVLVEAKDAQGTLLPRGASVFDPQDNFIGLVGNDGQIFLADADPEMTLEVQVSGKTLCSLSLHLAEPTEQPGLYETAHALCR